MATQSTPPLDAPDALPTQEEEPRGSLRTADDEASQDAGRMVSQRRQTNSKDPGESFRTKLTFSLVDKGLIAFVVGVGVFWFQSTVNEQAAIRDLMLKVGGVHAEITRAERKELVNAVAVYLGTIEAIRLDPSGPDKTQSRALAQARHDFNTSVSNINAVYRDFRASDGVKRLRQALTETSSSLPTSLRGAARLKMLQARIDSVRLAYGEALADLRDASIKAVKADVKAVLETLREEESRAWWTTRLFAGCGSTKAPS